MRRCDELKSIQMNVNDLKLTKYQKENDYNMEFSKSARVSIDKYK